MIKNFLFWMGPKKDRRKEAEECVERLERTAKMLEAQTQAIFEKLTPVQRERAVGLVVEIKRICGLLREDIAAGRINQ